MQAPLPRLVSVFRGSDRSTVSADSVGYDAERDVDCSATESIDDDDDYSEEGSASQCDSEDTPGAKYLRRRQLPVYVDQMRTMIAEFDDPCAQADQLISLGLAPSLPSAPTTFKELKARLARFVPHGDRLKALCTGKERFVHFVTTVVSCVGCRRWMETLYEDCRKHGYNALEPFYVDADGTLCLADDIACDDRALHRYLVANYSKYQLVSEQAGKVAARRSKRCPLHSLEFSCTPGCRSGQWCNHPCRSATNLSWDDVWSSMSVECREETCIVETDALGDMFETYQQKHKFCVECRSKLSRAYDCLIGKVDVSKQTQYNAALYHGLKYCNAGEHIHVKASLPYLNGLIERAEAELAGSSRERHAKTLEMGQIEVLTCLGLYLHGRLCRLTTHMRTLHTAFQLLYSAAAMCTYGTLKARLDEGERALAGDLDTLCASIEQSNEGKCAKKSKKKVKSKQSGLDRQVQQCKRKKSRSPSPPKADEAPERPHQEPSAKAAGGRRQAALDATAAPPALVHDENGCESDEWTPSAASRIKAKKRRERHTAGTKAATQAAKAVLHANTRRNGVARGGGGQGGQGGGKRQSRTSGQEARRHWHSGDGANANARSSPDSLSSLSSAAAAAHAPIRNDGHMAASVDVDAAAPVSAGQQRRNESCSRDVTSTPRSADHGYSSREGSPPSPALAMPPHGDTASDDHAAVAVATLCPPASALSVDARTVPCATPADSAGGGGKGISCEAIAWHKANAQLVDEQRRQLRERLWRRFNDMQMRLGGGAQVPNDATHLSQKQ